MHLKHFSYMLAVLWLFHTYWWHFNVILPGVTIKKKKKYWKPSARCPEHVSTSLCTKRPILSNSLFALAFSWFSCTFERRWCHPASENILCNRLSKMGAPWWLNTPLGINVSPEQYCGIKKSKGHVIIKCLFKKRKSDDCKHFQCGFLNNEHGFQFDISPSLTSKCFREFFHTNNNN